MTRRHIVLLAVSTGVFLIVAFFGWQGARAWWAWRGIDRIEFNVAEARSLLLTPLPEVGVDVEVESTPPPLQLIEYETVLVIGNDLRPDASDRQERAYADAVLFWLEPTNGGGPVLVSLPRDLLVVNPCTGDETKLDRTLAGCGDNISGPELVALAVEDYTGIGVDHFATFGFEGFVGIIDSIGGVEICVEYALREGGQDIVPAGCSTADGETALRWIRSRNTQELVDGEWRFVAGVSDAARAQRQQELMFAMLARLKEMRSPTAVAGIAESLGDTIALDESLSMGEAVAMVWDLRTVPSSQIGRIIVPTEPAVTTDGSFALRATKPFRELLEG